MFDDQMEFVEPIPAGLISKEVVAKITGIVVQDPY
jgi:hypothetical protein